MDLTVREAATLMGRSARTVRAQVARGDLPGRKVNGRWQIRRRDLPLTEPQRAVLQAKAERLRRTVEAALPSRLAGTSGSRHRSLADLDAFRLGIELLEEIRTREDGSLPAPVRRRVDHYLERALLAVADGVQQYQRRAKLESFNRARSLLARSAALLLIGSGLPPPDPVFDWVTILETKILPSVAGLARWADTLGRRK